MHGSDFPLPFWPIAACEHIDTERARCLRNECSLLDRDSFFEQALVIGRQTAKPSYRLTL